MTRAKIFFFLLIPVLCSFSGGKKITFNINPSDIYRVQVVSKQHTTRRINEAEYNVYQEVESVLAFSIEEVQNDVFQVHAWYENLILLIENNYCTIELNSTRDPGDDIMDGIVREIINKKFYLNISKDGKIKRISGFDEIYKDAFSTYNFLDSFSKKELKNSLEETIGRKALSLNFEFICSFYPKNEVKVGDSWQNSIKQEKFVSTKFTNKYKLQEFQDNIFTVEMNNELNRINTTHSCYSEELVNMPVNINLQGVQRGIMKIDQHTGWMTEGNIKQEFFGYLNVKECKNFPNGMVCPVKYLMESQFKHLD